jgi:NACHT domain
MGCRSLSITDFEGQLTDWNNTIPFFIRLRQYVESGLPAPENWPRLVTPAIAATMPSRWVHHQLASGRAVVLVDGIDELPQSERSAVREWLKELVETYKDARFIVSSRPHAVEEGWLEREGFDDAELQPIELADIFAFIDHWHEAVREELREEDEKDELSELAEHLKGVVRDNRSIHSLATSPLLCAMLCALHREPRRQLPSDRVELYEASCQMLLERRDIEHRVILRDYPQLSYRQKRALLQDFAYWLLTNGWSEVAYERADERLALKLSNMEGIVKGIAGADVRRLFMERSGLLREPVPGHIDFTHRTFQEFLAAQAALDEGDSACWCRTPTMISGKRWSCLRLDWQAENSVKNSSPNSSRAAIEKAFGGSPMLIESHVPNASAMLASNRPESLGRLEQAHRTQAILLPKGGRSEPPSRINKSDPSEIVGANAGD